MTETIPEGWEETTIGQVSKKVTDGTHKTPKYLNEGVPFISTNNLVPFSEKFKFNNYLKYISKEEHKELTKRCKPEYGDILVSKCGTIGRTQKVREKLEFSIFVGLALIKLDNNKVNSDFIEQILNSPKLNKEMQLAAPGATRKTLTIKGLSDLKILLPTLPEQEKIAVILSKTDEQIQLTEEIIAKTEELKKGLMQELLTKGIGHTEFKETELGKIPKEWVFDRLPTLLSIIDYRGRTPPFSDEGLPYIGADCLTEGNQINIKKPRFVTEETYEQYMSRGIPSNNSILFTTEAPLGKVAKTPNYKFCFAQRLVSFETKDSSNTDFFIYLFKLEKMQKQFVSWATGTTVLGISSKNMRFIRIYKPKSKEEQDKISSILRNMDIQINNERSYLLTLNDMKKGLMQDLLTGKVRVKISG